MEIAQAIDQINMLQRQVALLENENASLKANQEAFQNALIDEVKRIELTPKAFRWLQYGKLLFQLIDTIKGAIDKVKK